jgi:FkbM family methyltransferase
MSAGWERAAKALGYLSLPFLYRDDFLRLLRVVLIQRALAGELLRLTPHRRWLAGAGIRTVIDVGALTGAFAFAIRHLLPAAQVYSFEPLPDSFARLQRNLAPYGRWQGFQTALGAHSGEVRFHRSDFTASSSVLPMSDLHKTAFPESAGGAEVTVPLARLDDMLERIELRPPVLLKLDVQGYELEVLRGAQALLPQVDYLMTEVSYRRLYQGGPLFDEVYQALRGQGFLFAGSLETLLSPLDGAVLQSDALFIQAQPARETG